MIASVSQTLMDSMGACSTGLRHFDKVFGSSASATLRNANLAAERLDPRHIDFFEQELLPSARYGHVSFENHKAEDAYGRARKRMLDRIFTADVSHRDGLISQDVRRRDVARAVTIAYRQFRRLGGRYDFEI